MTSVLTAEIFASRFCEAPASAQTKLLSARGKILRAGSHVPKLLLAVFVLPVLYATYWLLLLLMAAFAPLCVSLNQDVIRKCRGLLTTADLSVLRRMTALIDSQLPKLKELMRIDASIRTKSELYNWLVAGFDQELDGLIADYEDIVEAVQIGLDPKWRERLTGEHRVGAHVA